MNLDQARAIAEEYFNGVRRPGSTVEIRLHGFGGGYVAWAVEPEPDDPGVLPDTVGGGCVVIDKYTGELALRPLLHPEAVAEQWPGPRLR
ncbi:PepSY domain-containing protein [Streptosporangium sandarakinum]|uniref:Immunity protein 35 domain-containing protein n=2 Tax=Streptosporangium TaxID=2000 RepID=A0A852UWB4_9ACTN|nr:MULTISPECIES: PepSY domain-containing protein [Streptosporangium]NYF39513.1 hypothetical protein [Streptosporangium sandarakinum]GGP88812.1 hypothetical protein GCM10010140_18230 [Streptosporangium pseudovulgare]